MSYRTFHHLIQYVDSFAVFRSHIDEDVFHHFCKHYLKTPFGTLEIIDNLDPKTIDGLLLMGQRMGDEYPRLLMQILSINIRQMSGLKDLLGSIRKPNFWEVTNEFWKTPGAMQMVSEVVVSP